MSVDIQCEKILHHDFSDVTTREVLLDWEDFTHRLRSFIRKNENEIYNSRTEDGYLRLNISMAVSLVEFMKEQLDEAGYEPFEINAELSSLINAVEEKIALDEIPECPVRTEILITFL